MKSSILSIAVATSLLSFAAKADQPNKLTWGLGAAIISQDQGYVDVGNETEFVPALALQYGNFSILGPQASYKFYAQGNIEISATAHLRLDGFEESDGDIFLGMEERDMSFDAGLEAEIDTDFGEFGFELMQDVTSTHEGYELSASYGIPVRYEQGRVMPYVAVNYTSEDLNDYYFGVMKSEATLDRPFYEASGTTNFEIGIGSDWMFQQRHMVKADIRYTSYGSDIKDSPLVDKSGSLQVLVGYVYVF